MTSKALGLPAADSALVFKKTIITKTLTVLLSGLVLSAAIIIYSNYTLRYDALIELYSSFELELLTILPYMLAAVVAAITALAVIHLVPNMRTKFYADILKDRIIELGRGDLVSTTKYEISDPNLKPMAKELRNAIGVLNNSVANLKIINRQQWEYLQSIKQALLKEDCGDIRLYVSKMEANWDKIVEIEETIET